MGKVIVGVGLMVGMVGGHLMYAFASDARTQTALVDDAVSGALPALAVVETHYAQHRAFPPALADSNAAVRLAIDPTTGAVSATYRENFRDAELNAVYAVQGRGVELTPIVGDGRIQGWRCVQTLGYAKAGSCRDGQTVIAIASRPGA